MRENCSSFFPSSESVSCNAKSGFVLNKSGIGSEIMMIMMKNLALFFLFVTVFAPIVLYTEKLGTFTNSSLEDEFREGVSTIRSSNYTLNEPIRIDLNNFSSNSVQSFGEIKGLIEDVTELSLVDLTEHKTRVLSATNVVNEGNASNELQEQEVIEEREVWEEVKADEQEVKNQISDNVINKRVSKTNQRLARTSEKADPKDPPKTSTRKGNSKTITSDDRVRYIKDQLIRGRVYLGLGATRTNPQFIRLLRLRIKELQRALGDATKDSELPRNASEKLKAMEQILAKGKQIQDDYTTLIKRLRAMLHSSEEQLRIHKKQEVFLTQLTAKTLPKGLHCLPLRLSTEYFSMNSSQQQFPYQEKLEDPKLYHYALFSDNVLAAAVVINSTISHAKDSRNHVFHMVTDRLNYAAMRMWFLANPPKKASIQVQNIEEFTWLNSSYSPVLKQLRSRSMMEYYFKVQHSKSDSNLKFRNPKYLSILNHLRFYLPEIFPKLNKVLFLDDDIVVQKDLTPLWSLDLQGKVNGAVETCGESFHRFNRYLNFSNPLISKNFDPHACGWAYGMNIFDLEEWKKQNVTDIYHTWQKLNQDRELWKLGTLPPGLITFWNRTFPISPSWHVLGLGYNPNVDRKEIEQAAVIHYNGNMKPWLEIGIVNYRSYWTKFVDYNQVFLRECNINP